MLAQSGIDCVFIDTEHVPIPIDTLAWMCNTFSGLGVPPITRVRIRVRVPATTTTSNNRVCEYDHELEYYYPADTLAGLLALLHPLSWKRAASRVSG